MGLFSKKKKEVEKEECCCKAFATIKFSEGDIVTYKDVQAGQFFMFRDDIFYRADRGAGKNVVTGESFSNFIKAKYIEFENTKMNEISTLSVTTLNII